MCNNGNPANVVATDTAVFGNRWWLCNDSGAWTITRERSPGGTRRCMDFDSEQEARDYFAKYTAKYVEQTA